ncbi:MAG: A/G-specific adenine glycosylase [Campylobacterota bacterium]|nr:A/G-specific adenine glycosylase [Campylobacterota bacterium]
MSNTLKNTHNNIQDWYRINGRHDLPWRLTNDAYKVYLSEVMLQQTQVKTVLERFYFPFLEAFPTLQDLADSNLDDVLKKWEGLGYYTRAKNLHRTAQVTGGKLPTTLEELLKLPGIGDNTAHAIAIFAFHQAVPIMEANVKRILCRIHRLENPTHKILWKAAYELLDSNNAYDYNQAMMDIGSMVCLPKEPKCGSCPLAEICKGKEKPQRYPIKKKKLVPTREKDIIVYSYNDRYALQQRKERLLHGLWGFPSTDNAPYGAEYVGEVTQQYTHFKLKCSVYHYPEANPKQEHYFSIDSIDKLAISKVDEKIIKLLLQFWNE